MPLIRSTFGCLNDGQLSVFNGLLLLYTHKFFRKSHRRFQLLRRSQSFGTIVTELLAYLSNGRIFVEDLDDNRKVFVLTSMEKVSGAAPNLANELNILASNDLLE
jgi:hypothetical protein